MMMESPATDMNRRGFLAGVGSVTVAGCLGASGEQGGEYDIGMSSSRFKPGEFTVAPGTTVVWKNTSSHSHTVTAYDESIPDDAAFFASGGFESTAQAREGWRSGLQGAIESGGTYEHTFSVPGTYNYFCIPHETGGMVGVIEVTADATPTPE